MINIPQIKVGVVAVSRDCFPESLSVNRRKALMQAYVNKYGAESVYECPICIVESEIHIEISDELAELLYRERERQIKAVDYYGPFYTNYYCENNLRFDGRVPDYPVVANKISTDASGYPVHFVCIRENGTFISPRTMQHTSRIIKKEIFSGFDFHSLRHTHASMLAEAGVEPKYIQTRLGHANIKITIDVYEHTTDTMRDRGRRALNSIFN